MKILYLFLAVSLFSCNQIVRNQKVSNAFDSIQPKSDTIVEKKVDIRENTSSPAKMYSNTRFKEVTVEKTEENRYTIEGKAQIFEANFGWVIEDGHNELLKGSQMTDAGAPEWGNFNFSIKVQRVRPNTTLHLILFEASPKDGSRQYELPIVLE